MASIAIYDEVHDAARHDSGPIGSTDQAAQITARRVRISNTGVVEFGVEEPAVLYREIVRYLPDDFAPIARFEVKADPRVSPIRSEDSLVMTEVPYHNAWEVHSRFKRSWHGDKDLRAEQISRVLSEHGVSVSNPARAQVALSSLTFDPFETGRYLTAAVPVPSASLAPKPRSVGERARWVFGVCSDVEACRAALLACDRSRRLLELTESQQLELGPPAHRKRVSAAVKTEAHQIMMLAIRQALAGPADEADDGVPVMKLVEWLYKNHLYNWMRRQDGEPPTTPWRD